MTQEQKDKQAFFAQYFGQEVLLPHVFYNAKPIELTGYRLTKHSNHSGSSLKLKPLSSITDEDAIEVANILKFRGDNLIQNVKELLTGNDHWLNKHINPFLFGQVLDFLRSRSFLLPFRNYTTDQIIEMGWAKLQEI